MSREILDEHRNLRVVCIYDAFHCRVCDRKTPHVELTHHTANNVDLKERPWDTHRLEKGMMCLAHSDIELPLETLVDLSFLHKKTGVYVDVKFVWHQQGMLTTPAQDGYRACTDHYSIRLDYTKGTKRGEWLGGGFGGAGVEEIIHGFPFGNQQAMDTILARIATERVEQRFSDRMPKDEPEQLEMFSNGHKA